MFGAVAPKEGFVAPPSGASFFQSDYLPNGIIVSRTFVEPARKNPRRSAAARVTSRIRPRTKGPRSFMRTTTHFPFCRFSTLTFVPKGKDRCAAVSAVGLQSSPEAVRVVRAYQDAGPDSAHEGSKTPRLSDRESGIASMALQVLRDTNTIPGPPQRAKLSFGRKVPGRCRAGRSFAIQCPSSRIGTDRVEERGLRIETRAATAFCATDVRSTLFYASPSRQIEPARSQERGGRLHPNLQRKGYVEIVRRTLSPDPKRSASSAVINVGSSVGGSAYRSSSATVERLHLMQM